MKGAYHHSWHRWGECAKCHTGQIAACCPARPFYHHNYLALTLIQEILHYILKYCIKVFLRYCVFGSSSAVCTSLISSQTQPGPGTEAVAPEPSAQAGTRNPIKCTLIVPIFIATPSFCRLFSVSLLFYPYIDCFVIELLIFEFFFCLRDFVWIWTLSLCRKLAY